MTFESSYLVFDFEVTVRCPIGNNKANPHWPGNHPVMVACSASPEQKKVVPSWYWYDRDWSIFKWVPGNNLYDSVTNATILVGCNLPFDLMWLKRVSNNTVDLSQKTVWDVAVAEYILSGQESKFPSLDELSAKYGLPIKDTKVSDMWKAGYDTVDIPKTLLIPYGRQDVENTEKIFLLQLQEAKKKGCLKLILAMNDALLAITEMMWNGMKVDRKLLESFTAFYRGLVAGLEARFQTETYHDYGVRLNIGSPKHLSALLYGGELDFDRKEQIGEFKSGLKKGQPRYKTIVDTKKFPQLFNPENVGVPKTEHGWSTADEWLEKIEEYTKAGDTYKYVKIIREYREYDKQLNTYFINTGKLLFPEDYIYHNLNPTTTNTARLSSSEPNLQNVTSGEKSDIKKCYISRYGKKGVLIELDFEQLEMCGLAQLSGDLQLIDDIKNEVDIHSALFESLFGKKPTKEERRQFKRCSFALIYGAGYKKIAKTAGVPETVARAFIVQWTRRYPHTAIWWATIQKQAVILREPSTKRDVKSGIPLGVAKMHMPTGRILTFTETCPPWAPTSPTFSPKKVSNRSWMYADIPEGMVHHYAGNLFRSLDNLVK